MFSFTSGVFCDTDLVNKILKNYDNNYDNGNKFRKPAAISCFFFIVEQILVFALSPNFKRIT